MRFQNEAEWIKNTGGVVVQLHRKGVTWAEDHESEKPLTGVTEFSLFIDDTERNARILAQYLLKDKYEEVGKTGTEEDKGKE